MVPTANRKQKRKASSTPTFNAPGSPFLDQDEEDRNKISIIERFPLCSLTSVNSTLSSVFDLSKIPDGYPSFWNRSSSVKTVDIPLDSDIGKVIIDYFKSSLATPTSNLHKKVNYSWPVRIVANTNVKMFQNFQDRHKRIVEHEGAANAVWGWHGVGSSISSKSLADSRVNSILNYNYSHLYNISGKGMWGYGTYFAGNANYSFPNFCDNYDIYSSSLPGFKTQRPLQERSIILNMILLGKTMTVTDSHNQDGAHHHGYNSRSIPNDGRRNQLYVLGAGTDYQSFPAFVIYFENYRGYDNSLPTW